MTRRDFVAQFHELDAIAVETLWRIYLANRDPYVRADIVTALERLEGQAEVAQFGARRSGFPPTPAVVPHLS